MAISRPLLLTLIGAVLAVATFYAVTSARDASPTETAVVTPAAETQQAPAAKPAAAKLSAAEVMKAAVTAPPVKSGRFEGTLSVSGGEQQGTVDLTGAFQAAGPQDMLKAEVHLKIAGDGKDVDAGFVSTGDKGYVISDGTAYQLADDTWTQAVQARASQPAQASPLAFAAPGLDPSKWVRDVKDEGTETLDGVETRHVSATIDGAAAVRDLSKVAGGALRANAADVKDAKLDAWVGTEDRIIRRVSAELGVGKETIKLDFSLSEVNDPQTIQPPANVTDTLPGGLSPILTQSVSVAIGGSPDAIELPANDNPQRLDRAVAKHKPAVLFFHQAKGLDDKATADAVRTLDRRTNVLVLDDDVRNADRYGKLVEDLGVTQSPSIVIVARDGKARLVEGFVDSQTLLQDVADAR